MNKKLWKNKEKDRSNDKARENAGEIISEILPLIVDYVIPNTPKIIIAKKELIASSDSILNENLISKALVKAKSENKSTVDDIEQIYSELEAEWKKHNKTKASTWDLIIPFDVKTKKRKIQIFDNSFVLCSKDSLKKEFRKQTFLRGNEKEFTVEDLPNYSIRTRVKDVDIKEAWFRIESCYNLLRGILDFSTNVYQWQTRVNDPYRKRTKIGIPDFVLGLNYYNEMKVLRFAKDSEQKFNTLNLESKQENILNTVAKIFDRNIKKGSIENLIEDSLRLYAQALESMLPHNCFLGLWQMLERMCCSELSGGNTKEIINRLKFYRPNFNLFGSGYFYIMEKLAKKRNNIVHRGIHDQISEEDINILKVICEIVLRWIIDNRKEIKTEHHLDEYYRLKKVDSKKLIAKADMISFIMKGQS